MKEVFWYFLRLGWLAFGGPVGQIGLMHLEVVERRRWIDEEEFVQALNFCHVLPGPEALQLAIYIGYKKRSYLGGLLAGILFIIPGFITLTALGWVYVHFGRTPQVMGVLWGFRPVGLALLLEALVRISRATLKSRFQVALAISAFAAFYVGRLQFILVLAACGLAYLAWRKLGPGSGIASMLAVFALPGRAEAVESAALRLGDISWFFLKVGLVSFGGAYAALPYIREGAVLSYGWINDHQMIDALALGETTPGPLISIGIFVGFLAGDGAAHELADFTSGRQRPAQGHRRRRRRTDVLDLDPAGERRSGTSQLGVRPRAARKVFNRIDSAGARIGSIHAVNDADDVNTRRFGLPAFPIMSSICARPSADPSSRKPVCTTSLLSARIRPVRAFSSAGVKAP